MILALAFELDGWSLAALVVAVIVLLPYLGGPLLIYATQKLEAKPRLVPFDVEEYDWPKPVERLFNAAQAGLEEEGFDLLGGFFLPSAAPNVKTALLLFANRETRDSAMATAMYATGAGDGLKTLYVEFSTRFSDGRVVNTLNSKELGSFPTPEHVTTHSLPSVRDARKLYRVHRAATQEVGGRSQKALRVDTDFGGDAARYLQSAISEEYEEATKAGYLFRADRHFRPTVLGAMRMVWKELWPWKMIRRMRRARAERELLERLGPGEA